MKKLIASLITLTAATIAVASRADVLPAPEASTNGVSAFAASETASAPSLVSRTGDYVSTPYVHTVRHNWVGVQFDLGAPDGIAFGVVVRPKVEWLRIEAAVTHNGLAPGGRLGLTLDPIDFGIAPTFTAEAGFAEGGTVPGHANDIPGVGYDYVNLHLGVEFGSRNYWRFFVHAGPSYVHVSTSNFSSIVNEPGTQLGNPTADVWLLPTAKLGFALYF